MDPTRTTVNETPVAVSDAPVAVDDKQEVDDFGLPPPQPRQPLAVEDDVVGLTPNTTAATADTGVVSSNDTSAVAAPTAAENPAVVPENDPVATQAADRTSATNTADVNAASVPIADADTVQAVQDGDAAATGAPVELVPVSEAQTTATTSQDVAAQTPAALLITPVRTNLSAQGRTASTLADMSTPLEIFTGQAAPQQTVLTLQDNIISNNAGDALFGIKDVGRTSQFYSTPTDGNKDLIFALKRGRMRRQRWRVNTKGRKKLPIVSKQRYSWHMMNLDPTKEVALHSNQLRLGRKKTTFENKAIVGKVLEPGNKLEVCKGFDLAVAAAMLKAKNDSLVKRTRFKDVVRRKRSKASVKSSATNATAAPTTAPSETPGAPDNAPNPEVVAARKASTVIYT